MPAKTRLILLRHTAVGVPSGFCYGQTDVPVAATYEADLEVVRRILPDLPFARVFSSPLQRCHRLAMDLNHGPVITDARLKEMSFGDWEGQLWSDIPRALSDHWLEDVLNRTTPGGESFAQLIARAQSFLQDLVAEPQGSPILVVTHAGVIRAFHHLISGDDYASSLRVPIAFGECHSWDL